MNRLNCFANFENKPPGHEDTLTRALLTVLRLSPIAHAAFIDLIREAQRRESNPNPLPPFSALYSKEFSAESQVGSINQQSGRVISVLLTDKDWRAKGSIEWSKREPVYDGILYYPPDWIVVIENKPRSEAVWPEQLNPKALRACDVELDPQLVVLVWSEIIETIQRLCESDIVRGGEALLASDLFVLLEEYFDYLNPYTSFLRCQKSIPRLQKRCNFILKQLAPNVKTVDDHIECADGEPLKRIYLRAKEVPPDSWEVYLALWPADTMAQAKPFYIRADRVRLVGLGTRPGEEGWYSESNLHLSFGATGLFSPAHKESNEAYFDFWYKKNQEGQIRARSISDKNANAEFSALFDELLEANQVSESDREEFDRHFTNTARRRVNICPGWEVCYEWKKDAALALEAEGKFENDIRFRIDQALSIWGQRFPS